MLYQLHYWMFGLSTGFKTATSALCLWLLKRQNQRTVIRQVRNYRHLRYKKATFAGREILDLLVLLTGTDVMPCTGTKIQRCWKCLSRYLTDELSQILGTAVAQLLKCCATNRKVAGSIPDGVIGIFHWHNPSDRTMALRSTQPLTEMSTRSISWGKKRPVRESDNLTTILCCCHVIWEP